MFSFASKHDDPKANLGWSERIGYGMGNYGLAWVNGIMSAFFMLYLTNVSFVDAGVAGTIIALSKVFDGVSDLIMGGIVDRTKSKHGKARIWLVRMCIPMAIATLLLFSVPASMTTAVKYIYIFVMYNLVNSVFYTSMYVPYTSMNYLMTQNDYERGLLGNMNMIFQTLANITMNTFFLKWLGILGAGDIYTQEAWTKVFIVVGLIVVASSVLCFFGTKERTSKVDKKTEIKDSAAPMKAVKSLFKNKYWVLMTVCMFLIFFVIVMYAVAAAYYAQYVLGDINFYGPINNALSIAQFGIMFLTPLFMKRFGKHRTYQVGLLAMLVGFAGTGICGTNMPLLILFNAIKGIGLGASGGMAFGMVSDTIEYGEWKSGIVAVGMGNAGVSTAQKLGLGLGQAVLGWILAGAGFDAAQAVQAESAQTAISFCYNWIPVICVVLCSILMLFYRLDKEMPGIRAEIAGKK